MTRGGFRDFIKTPSDSLMIKEAIITVLFLHYVELSEIDSTTLSKTNEFLA
jgi:hypothetical protein